MMGMDPGMMGMDPGHDGHGPKWFRYGPMGDGMAWTQVMGMGPMMIVPWTQDDGTNGPRWMEWMDQI